MTFASLIDQFQERKVSKRKGHVALSLIVAPKKLFIYLILIVMNRLGLVHHWLCYFPFYLFFILIQCLELECNFTDMLVFDDGSSCCNLVGDYMEFMPFATQMNLYLLRYICIYLHFIDCFLRYFLSLLIFFA